VVCFVTVARGRPHRMMEWAPDLTGLPGMLAHVLLSGS